MTTKTTTLFPLAAGLVLAPLLLPTLPVQAAPPLAVPTLEWHLTLTHAAVAWALGADGHGITVMVIDTGLDSHMARGPLAGSVVPSFAVNPLHGLVTRSCPSVPANDYTGAYQHCTYPVVLSDPSPYVDTYGHGSFVTCELACHGDGYLGIAPAVHVVVGRSFTSSGADPRDVAKAIRWGAIHHVAIESLSLGSPFASPEEEAAIAFARRMGVLVVAAAGNDGDYQSIYPGSYPGVLRIGATDRWNRLASFSDSGPDIALTAPGAWVFGLAPEGQTSMACAGLCTFPGTSMATPLVAGALADLLSWGLSSADAVAAIEGGAHRWPGMDPLQYGAGVLDLAGALHWARAHHLHRHLGWQA